MFDPLVHRKDGKIACAAQAAMVDDALQVAKHAIVSVGNGEQAINHVRPGKVQAVFGDFRAVEVEERIGAAAKELSDRCHIGSSFVFSFS